MSKKTVELDVCDICKFDPAKITELTAIRKCEVCERMLCNNEVHIANIYESTQHMNRKFTQFVCVDCWDLGVRNVGYNNGTQPLPHPGIDLHASGQTGAINLGEFREWVESDLRNMANQAVIDVLREIRKGAKANLEKEAVLKQLKEKYDEDLAKAKATITESVR